MKTRLIFATVSLCILAGCATARMYPVRGQLAAAMPAPVYTAKITNPPGSYSGKFSTVLNGEKFEATWHQVPRVVGSAASPNLSAEWNDVYGVGFYQNIVLPAQLYLRCEAKGDHGTTLDVEMYYNQTTSGMSRDEPVDRILKGVARDSNGNVFKLVIPGWS